MGIALGDAMDVIVRARRSIEASSNESRTVADDMARLKIRASSRTVDARTVATRQAREGADALKTIDHPFMRTLGADVGKVVSGIRLADDDWQVRNWATKLDQATQRLEHLTSLPRIDDAHVRQAFVDDFLAMTNDVTDEELLRLDTWMRFVERPDASTDAVVYGASVVHGDAKKFIAAQGIDLGDAAKATGTDGAGAAPSQTRFGASYRPAVQLHADLAGVSTDLTAQAVATGGLRGAVGRDAELARILGILDQPTSGNNPLLVGEPGSGKTALLQELANRIVSGDVPESLRNTRLVQISMNDLTAGTKYRGEFEERLQRVAENVRNAEGKIVLVIDEAHQMGSAGRSMDESGSAGEKLKTYLTDPKFRVVGATTTEEVEGIRKDPALMSRFAKVDIGPLDDAGVLRALRGTVLDQLPTGVSISDDALRSVRDLSNRYLHSHGSQPRAAFTLLGEATGAVAAARTSIPAEILQLRSQLGDARQELRILQQERAPRVDRIQDLEARISTLAADEAAATAAVARARSALEGTIEVPAAELAELRQRFPDVFVDEVTDAHVRSAVRTLTNVEPSARDESPIAWHDHVRDVLRSRVVGNHEASDTIARELLDKRLGLKDAHLPAFAGISYGPPGVGKTEMAKALSSALDAPLVRIDAGTVATNGGDPIEQLITKLRNAPNAVVLVDEVEKADPRLMDGLLTALGEGFITDRNGRRVDTSNAVFQLTANLRSEPEVRQHFRREFIDRMDALMEFEAPDAAARATIVDGAVDAALERVAAQSGIAINIDDAARGALRGAFDGSDANQGVRALKSDVRRMLGDAARTQLASAAPNSSLTITTDAAGRLTAVPA